MDLKHKLFFLQWLLFSWLSQSFALAISILLPLIAHWTWSWVNGLVLSRLEKISFPLSKLNKNKEIKLNTEPCLNNSRAVTWGRKLKDKADDLPRSATGMKVTISHNPAFLWGSISCLSEQWLSGVRKQHLWAGLGGGMCNLCNLPLCCSPPLCAGSELVPQCRECSVSKGAGTSDRSSKAASNHCPHTVHPSWTGSFSSGCFRVRDIANLGILCWHSSSFSDTSFYSLIQGQKANNHLFHPSLSSLDENWKLCLHLMLEELDYCSAGKYHVSNSSICPVVISAGNQLWSVHSSCSLWRLFTPPLHAGVW